MPNLLPDWSVDLGNLGVFDVRAAGRLIWFSLLLIYGIAIAIALTMPPKMKRPFPDVVGYAAIPGIIIGGLVLGAIIKDLQRTIILAAIALLAAHIFMLVLSREPRDPERKATWAECFVGAVGVFALFILAYAIVPHEWLEFANKQLNWGDNAKFVFQSGEPIFGLFYKYPFSFDFPALRDIVVTGMYVQFLVLNIVLWSRWQKRFEVKPETTDETAPARRSRFGRPLRRQRADEPTVPVAPAPEGA
jgi:hypothetical protein